MHLTPLPLSQGHSLYNDLAALRLDHSDIIDTALIFSYKWGREGGGGEGGEGTHRKGDFSCMCRPYYDIKSAHCSSCIHPALRDLVRACLNAAPLGLPRRGLPQCSPGLKDLAKTLLQIDMRKG